MARLAHEPTDEDRRKVKALAAVGTRQEDIALVMSMSVDTLARHYRQELDHGRIEAVARVAQSLYQAAVGGDRTAQIFYLKTQGGWRETTNVEHSQRGPLNVVNYTPEQLAKLPIEQLQALQGAIAVLGQPDNAEDDDAQAEGE